MVATISPALLETDPVQYLLWIPGIGRINAFFIFLEIDDITRFPSAKHFLSYARLVPGSSTPEARPNTSGARTAIGT